MIEKQKRNKRGLQRKILLLSVSLVVIAIAVLTVVGIILIRSAGRRTAATTRAKAEIINEKSSESMLSVTRANLVQTVNLAARLINEEFWLMEHDYYVLCEQAEDIFAHPERYGEVEISPPQKENEGKYVLQVLYANEKSKTDEKTQTLLKKLANLEPMMSEIVGGNGDFLMECFIALPDGTMLIMDKFSGRKFNEDGTLKTYKVAQEDWFLETKKLTKDYVIFTSAVQSKFYNLTEVIFAVPVFLDGEIVAILEGSVNLDTFRKLISGIEFGERGFSILMDSDYIIYSPRTEGELMMDNEVSTSIKGKVNADLEDALIDEKGWTSGFKQVTVDNESYYAAYDHIESTAWKLFMFVPQDEIESPTYELLTELYTVNQEALSADAAVFSRTIVSSVTAFALLVVLAVIISIFFSSRIAGPISLMTEKVQEISGDNLVFELEDAYKTGDEIEILGDAFKDMSDRTRTYISELMDITTEKERMAAELSAAAMIQDDMLPKDFSMFDENGELDLYATMNPAKEVGGDFYDFFMIDDDHLALVIGDVSGKGISASLFMVKSKMLIQNRARMGGTPARILEDVNEKLRVGNTALMFVTVWIGILTLSTGHVVEANGGHNDPALLSNGKNFELIKKKHDSLLGIRPGKKYRDDEFDLSDGACLFVYTDGVNEAENPERMQFGTDRMLKVLDKNSGESSKNILSAMSAELKSFAGEATQFDDITMMAIRWRKKK